LRTHPAMDVARRTVSQWVASARAVLEPLPSGAPREALESVCDLIERRA